jgi:Zn-dependent peptidase ImmA (M78 family)
MNRAFAAEFLAPADLIQERLADSRWDHEEVVEHLAEEFGVSTWVIEYQIRNQISKSADITSALFV